MTRTNGGGCPETIPAPSMPCAFSLIGPVLLASSSRAFIDRARARLSSSSRSLLSSLMMKKFCNNLAGRPSLEGPQQMCLATGD